MKYHGLETLFKKSLKQEKLIVDLRRMLREQEAAAQQEISRLQDEQKKTNFLLREVLKEVHKND